MVHIKSNFNGQVLPWCTLSSFAWVVKVMVKIFLPTSLNIAGLLTPQTFPILLVYPIHAYLPYQASFYDFEDTSLDFPPLICSEMSSSSFNLNWFILSSNSSTKSLSFLSFDPNLKSFKVLTKTKLHFHGFTSIFSLRKVERKYREDCVRLRN